MKSHDVEVKDFYNKKIPNEDSDHTYLAVSLDSAIKKDDKYYM